MNDYRNDQKVKKAENILFVSKTVFAIFVFLCIASGIVFISLFIHSVSNSTPLYSYLIVALSSFLAILVFWVIKQFLDGFALIVYDSAINLHEKGIETSLDEAKSAEESLEERLKNLKDNDN